MRIRKIIKRILPKRIIYRHECSLQAKNANMTYADVENMINTNFAKVFGRNINWDNPISYNEKINVAKLYNVTPTKICLTDKILAAEWAKKQLGNEGKIIPLIATYDSVDEIDFSKLPKRYVIKMNNDSGSVFICDEKHPITKDIIEKYRYYFQKRNYAYNNFEMHYKDIKPKIMIEKYIGIYNP